MSLRWKITVVVAVLAALATTAVGVAGYRATRDRLYNEVDASLGNLPREVPEIAVSEIPDPPGRPGRPPRPIPLLYDIQVFHGDELRESTIEIDFLPAGVLTVQGDPGRSSFATVSSHGEAYRIRTVGTDDGAILYARPLDEVNRVLASLRARTFAIVILVTVAAAVLGWLISGRVTAGLRRLTAAADSVGATGRLDVDVPAAGADEVGRLGTAFRGMLAALSRSRAEQQRLVEDAGHELKTPLTSIRTNLDVLRRHRDLQPDDRARVVDDLHGEVEEMVELVEEIIAVSGGVASDEPATTFSLGDLAREVAGRAERRTGRTILVAADASTVHAQPVGMQRAIGNLIDNAVKFDQSGNSISVEVSDGRLSVGDRGPGIPEGELPMVFERFHRADDVTSLPGSGLGLAIVRDVIGRNGGTIHAANRDGGGATVGFTLPLLT